MKQYIEKDSILAAIEKKKIPFKKDIDDGVYPTYLCALMDFEDFIDTFEMKEVDLEKEIEHKIQELTYSSNYTKKYFREIAKHFFELGLEAKGE